MEIFKKKKLFCFLFLFFAFIPFINVKADEVYGGKTFPDVIKDGNDSYMIVSNGAGNDYFGFGTWLITYNKADIPYVMIDNTSSSSYPLTLTLFKSPTGSKYDAITYKAYKLVNNSWTLTYNRENATTSSYKYIQGLTNIYYSSENIYFYKNSYNKTLTLYYDDSGLVSRKSSECSNLKETITYTTSSSDTGYENILYKPYPLILLEEKKSFSYNNVEMSNPMRYIDLYFDKEDFGKKINFELKLEDYFDYSSCTYCEYLDIEKFEFSYLIKDDNGLYKWVDIPNTETGLYFDYDGETFPRNEDGTGLILTGRINLAYDTSLYEFERIRASIKISNGYNFKYTYSDDSNISDENIDEYYHYMMYNYGESRLNRIEGGSTKYTILTTTQEELNGKLVVQYINTDKWLYAEYFDTFNHTYLDNSGLYQEHYLFGGKDLGISEFIIGKNNNRGLYLMNYLYQKNDKNLNSKYYFYIPTEVSYSTTDYLDEAIYYDNDGNLNTTITANPNYETDNLNFIDNFRGIFNFLNDLQTTSDTFNYMWNSFYNTMPTMVQAFFKFMTHILCILMFMKIVGYD